MNEINSFRFRNASAPIFSLTESYVMKPEEIVYEYLDNNSFKNAYNYSLEQMKSNYKSKNSFSKIDEDAFGIFSKFESKLQLLIKPLFDDMNSIAFKNSPLQAPLNKKIQDSWHSCYVSIYSSQISHNLFDHFLSIIPYFYANSIFSIYLNLPIPLGLSTPSRTTIGLRFAYVFGGLIPIDLYVDQIMTRYFGIDPEKIVNAEYLEESNEENGLLMQIEDVSQLVDFERRPKNKKIKWSSNSRSPISHTPTESISHGLSFLYPPHGVSSFKKDLIHFDVKRKNDSICDDQNIKSLLLRSRSENVKANLSRVQMDTNIKRTKVMQRFQKDSLMIRSKHKAVSRASKKVKNTFCKELREMQEKGIYMEDPAITLSLIKTIPELQKSRKNQEIEDNVEEIVNSVLLHCADDEKKQNSNGYHLSYYDRKEVIDVNKVTTVQENL